MDISLAKVFDFKAIEKLWQGLESNSSGSFFQSWAWTGCLVEERFPDPVLLTARADNCIVGLGLFNNRRRRFTGRSTLWLGESGDPQYDAIFIEHNGLLLDRSQPNDLIGACLLAAQRGVIGDEPAGRVRSIMLSGVGGEYLTAASTNLSRTQVLTSRAAPFVDLAAIRENRGNFLASISANTRYQIRRSERRYAEVGPIAIRRAQTVDEAQNFLTNLASLHQAYWTRRGKPGAFANPRFERFHRTLIDRAFGSGGTDLLKVTAGAKAIGYLYNFLWGGQIYSYQSGFDYDLRHPHQKPGLTCHRMAIEMYLAEGARRYDFLAGPQQYKMSLSSDARELYWLRVEATRDVYR